MHHQVRYRINNLKKQARCERIVLYSWRPDWGVVWSILQSSCSDGGVLVHQVLVFWCTRLLCAVYLTANQRLWCILQSDWGDQLYHGLVKCWGAYNLLGCCGALVWCTGVSSLHCKGHTELQSSPVWNITVKLIFWFTGKYFEPKECFDDLNLWLAWDLGSKKSGFRKP